MAPKAKMSESEINRMWAAIEEYLPSESAPKSTDLYQEMFKIDHSYIGQVQSQQSQENAKRDKEVFITTHFPNLASVMFPEKQRNSTSSAESMNGRKEAFKKTSVAVKGATIIAVLKSDFAEKITPDNITPAPQKTITLKDRLNALKTAISSKEIEKFPDIKEHLQMVERELSSFSDKDKNEVINGLFKGLDSYIASENTVGATQFIIDKTDKNSALVEKRKAAKGKPVALAQTKPVPINLVQQKSIPVSNSREVGSGATKSEVQIKSSKVESNSNPIQLNSRIAQVLRKLEIYETHLKDQNNFSDPDIKLKLDTIVVLRYKLFQQDSTIKSAREDLNDHSMDLSFNRNPVLRLFGIKKTAWGSTGSKAVEEMKQILNDEPASRPKLR